MKFPLCEAIESGQPSNPAWMAQPDAGAVTRHFRSEKMRAAKPLRPMFALYGSSTYVVNIADETTIGLIDHAPTPVAAFIGATGIADKKCGSEKEKTLGRAPREIHGHALAYSRHAQGK
jgi:hypothetical protein